MNFKKLLPALSIAACSVMALSSCSKKEEVLAKDQLSQETISQIQKLGFSTHDAKAVEGGVLVEGDIILSDSDLKGNLDYQLMRVGDEEHYRTTNLVTANTTRTIYVAVSSSLPSAYVTAVDEVVRRFNAQNLRLRFQRVSSGYNVLFTAAPSGSGYLASAGFPSGGNPYNRVQVNVGAIGTANASTYIATILAHELGHCIGFRHTDYANRAYSCGGAFTNEGASTVGAIYIPGTPSAYNGDSSSWMLACIGSGANRPFNTNDVTALNYVY
ncbi:M57 family metalloprotease [Hymenobacter koreensis]|uniref:Protease n=1 Tax=Hymenobacter koreensis TaxID=1084523 RepID=A0ABP8IW06_9BACT